MRTRAQLQAEVPALVAQVQRDRRVAVDTLVSAADRFLLGVGVVHHEGVQVGADIALVRRDRRLGALEQAQAQLVGQLAQLGRAGIEPLAHPHAAGHLGEPERFLEEAVAAKRLDRLEVALAQAQQPHHRLDQIRGPHALRHRQPRVDHRLDLCRLTALPDQRQARVGGQVELGGLLDFEARHGRLGEGFGCVIIQLHQCVRMESGLSEHGFRSLILRPVKAL